MPRISHKTLILSALVGLAFVSVVGSTAVGLGQALARPTAVVSIDLPRVLAGLDQREEAQKTIKAMTDQFKLEQDAKNAEIERMREALMALPPADLDGRREAEEELARFALDTRGWGAYASEQLDIEKSLQLRDLDFAILKAIKELAEVNGYDLVVTSDVGRELTINPQSKAARELQVQNQMTQRRVLYSNEMTDVTEELIQRMNNAFGG